MSASPRTRTEDYYPLLASEFGFVPLQGMHDGMIDGCPVEVKASKIGGSAKAPRLNWSVRLSQWGAAQQDPTWRWLLIGIQDSVARHIWLLAHEQFRAVYNTYEAQYLDYMSAAHMRWQHGDKCRGNMQDGNHSVRLSALPKPDWSKGSC